MDNLDIDQEQKEHAYNNAQPEIVRYEILMRRYNWTINTWNNFMERYSDCTVWSRGGVIRFEGTEEQFDILYDKLIEDDTNAKVIDFFPGWSERKVIRTKADSYRIDVNRDRSGLAPFAMVKPFDTPPTREDVLEYLLNGAWGFDEELHTFKYHKLK